LKGGKRGDLEKKKTEEEGEKKIHKVLTGGKIGKSAMERRFEDAARTNVRIKGKGESRLGKRDKKKKQFNAAN